MESNIDHTQITLLEEIGNSRGAFGRVHLGKWRNKNVVVKEISIASEESVKRELTHLANAAHKNIIFLYGTYYHKNIIYLVMEYMDGGSLHNFLHTKYELAHVINWALQCAEAVAYLHLQEPRPVIHRDLNPKTLFLCDKHRCLKILDFTSVRDMRTNMTSNVGAATYRAPETIKGNSYTEKCDVYGWAVTLYVMISREPPYADLKDLDICVKVLEGMRPSLDKLNIPKTIKELLTKCWSDNANERPSMAAIVKELKQFPIVYDQLSL